MDIADPYPQNTSCDNYMLSDENHNDCDEEDQDASDVYRYDSQLGKTAEIGNKTVHDSITNIPKYQNAKNLNNQT